jgi:hypothetical protein
VNGEAVALFSNTKKSQHADVYTKSKRASEQERFTRKYCINIFHDNGSVAMMMMTMMCLKSKNMHANEHDFHLNLGKNESGRDMKCKQPL